MAATMTPFQDKTVSVLQYLIEKGWLHLTDRLANVENWESYEIDEASDFLIGWLVSSTEEAIKISQVADILTVPDWMHDESVFADDTPPQIVVGLDPMSFQLVIRGESYLEGNRQVEFSKVIAQEDLINILKGVRELGIRLYDVCG